MDAISVIHAIGRQVNRTRAQRVGRATGLAVLPLCQLRITGDHLGRRGPGRPGLLLADNRGAGPFETGPAHGNAIADRLVLAGHIVKHALRRVDDDRPRRLIRFKIDRLTAELLRDFLDRQGGDVDIGILGGQIGPLDLFRGTGLGRAIGCGHAFAMRNAGRHQAGKSADNQESDKAVK